MHTLSSRLNFIADLQLVQSALGLLWTNSGIMPFFEKVSNVFVCIFFFIKKVWPIPVENFMVKKYQKRVQ